MKKIQPVGTSTALRTIWKEDKGEGEKGTKLGGGGSREKREEKKEIKKKKRMVI